MLTLGTKLEYADGEIVLWSPALTQGGKMPRATCAATGVSMWAKVARSCTGAYTEDREAGRDGSGHGRRGAGTERGARGAGGEDDGTR